MPDNPVMLPVKLELTVITLEAALNVVTMLPYASLAVKVFVPVQAIAFDCDAAKLTVSWLNVPVLTVTAKRSEPLEAVIPAVLAATLAVSAAYNTRLELATPLLNVTTVLVPKLVATAVLLVALAVKLPLGDKLAPENTRVLSPVKLVTIFPLASFAVIVIV